MVCEYNVPACMDAPEYMKFFSLTKGNIISLKEILDPSLPNEQQQNFVRQLCFEQFVCQNGKNLDNYGGMQEFFWICIFMVQKNGQIYNINN